MIHKCLVNIFVERSKFLTPLTFSSIKIALDAPRAMYFVTCNIFFNKLTNACSIKVNNKYEEGTSKTKPEVKSYIQTTGTMFY